MKNNGILIVAVIAVIGVAFYFLTKKKSGSNVSTTMSNESTTGVTALFNTGAMSSLFGTFGKATSAVSGVIGAAGQPTPTAPATTQLTGTPRN